MFCHELATPMECGVVAYFSDDFRNARERKFWRIDWSECRIKIDGGIDELGWRIGEKTEARQSFQDDSSLHDWVWSVHHFYQFYFWEVLSNCVLFIIRQRIAFSSLTLLQRTQPGTVFWLRPLPLSIGAWLEPLSASRTFGAINSTRERELLCNR